MMDDTCTLAADGGWVTLHQLGADTPVHIMPIVWPGQALHTVEQRCWCRPRITPETRTHRALVLHIARAAA